MVIREEAKITGMTFAVLTFRGIMDCCPPAVALPCILLEYCTGMRRSASCSTTAKATMARSTAAMRITATTFVAVFFPWIKRS